MSVRLLLIAVVAVLAAIVALVVLAVVALPSSPTYPVDYFDEMHYSPAYRPGEPARLSVPAGAVPVTGRAPDVSQDRARGLKNPLPASPENLQRANQVYQTNCRPCHGADGRGDGFLASYFERAKLPKPVDLAGPVERSLSDGEIWAIIGNGIDGMPPFRNLLSADDRWLDVLHIRDVQGRTP